MRWKFASLGVVGCLANPSASFSFCVALYEALHGARPFAGETAARVRASVVAGTRARVVENRAVPSFVRVVIERGLALEPARRWPSMAMLIAALSDASARRRRRVVAISLVGAGGLAALSYGALEQRTRARCAELGEAATTHWEGARVELERVFLGSGSALASDTWPRVRELLVEWSARWADAREAACLARRAQEELAARREICLDHQLTEYRGLLAAFAEADGAAVGRAVWAATELPSAARCESVSWLLMGLDPEVALDETVERARGKLAAARASAYIGAYERGLELVDDALAEVGALADEAMRAEALLVRADLLRDQGSYARAKDDAARAFFLAGRVGHDRVASLAAIALIGITGAQLGQDDGVERWQPIAEMLLARLGLEDEVFAGSYHISVGAALRAQGELAGALSHYRSAGEVFTATLGARSPAMAQVENNLGTLLSTQGEDERALVHLRRGFEITKETLGPRHPEVATYLNNMGAVFTGIGALQVALDCKQRALEIAEHNLPADHPLIGITLLNRGQDLEALGLLDDALATYERATKIVEARFGREHEFFTSAEGMIGSVEAARGNEERAVVFLGRAVARAEAHGHTRDIAFLKYRLARVLADAGREPERVRRLAAEARELYRGQPESSEFIEDLEGLLGDSLASR